jgi:hypothetical protein
VSIVAKLRLGKPAFESSQRTDIFSFHGVHVRSKAGPAFYSLIVGDSFSGIKRPGCEAGQLIKDEWNLNFTHPECLHGFHTYKFNSFFYLPECGSQ